MTKAKNGVKVKRNGFWFELWHRLKKNKLAMLGLVLFTCFSLVSISAPILAPEGYDMQDYEAVLKTPSWEHPLGTDDLGRDLLVRIIWGGRVSILVGLYTMFFSGIIGIVLGMLAAFFKKGDTIIMRFVDILMSIPSTLLAISIMATLGAGMRNLIMAMVISYIPSFSRVMRAAALTVIEQEYIEAGRSIGAGNLRLMIYHVLPNSMAPLIVQITLGMATAILQTATLSFLGVGIPLPIPEWGAILSIGKMYFRIYPHMCIFPGLAILLTAFSLNVLGDGLRDALDPRLRT